MDSRPCAKLSTEVAQNWRICALWQKLRNAKTVLHKITNFLWGATRCPIICVYRVLHNTLVNCLFIDTILHIYIKSDIEPSPQSISCVLDMFCVYFGREVSRMTPDWMLSCHTGTLTRCLEAVVLR